MFSVIIRKPETSQSHTPW